MEKEYVNLLFQHVRKQSVTDSDIEHGTNVSDHICWSISNSQIGSTIDRITEASENLSE